MSGAIRVDWPKIKARLVEPDALCLVAIPNGFRHILLAIQERARWKATYRVDGYDYSDWDALDAMIAKGLAGLTDCVMLQDLIALEQQQNALLEQLLACCDPTGGVLQVPDNPPPVTGPSGTTIWPIGNPDNIPDTGGTWYSPVGSIAGDWPNVPDVNSDGSIGQEEWDNYLCAAGAFVIDAIILTLRWAAKAKRTVGEIADVLVDLALFVASHYVGGGTLGDVITLLDETYVAKWPLLLNAVSASAMETEADNLETVRDAIASELACGATPSLALGILLSALSSTIQDAAVLAFVSGALPLGPLVAMIYNAATDTGWKDDCTCNDLIAGWNLIPYVLTGAGTEYTAYGSACTITDLGDGLIQFEGQMSNATFSGHYVSYRQGTTWAIGATPGWTRTEYGLYVRRVSGLSDQSYGSNNPTSQYGNYDGTCELRVYNVAPALGADLTAFCTDRVNQATVQYPALNSGVVSPSQNGVPYTSVYEIKALCYLEAE